jgi:hypothetical protein
VLIDLFPAEYQAGLFPAALGNDAVNRQIQLVINYYSYRIPALAFLESGVQTGVVCQDGTYSYHYGIIDIS